MPEYKLEFMATVMIRARDPGQASQRLMHEMGNVSHDVTLDWRRITDVESGAVVLDRETPPA